MLIWWYIDILIWTSVCCVYLHRRGLIFPVVHTGLFSSSVAMWTKIATCANIHVEYLLAFYVAELSTWSGTCVNAHDHRSSSRNGQLVQSVLHDEFLLDWHNVCPLPLLTSTESAAQPLTGDHGLPWKHEHLVMPGPCRGLEELPNMNMNVNFRFNFRAK